MDRRSLFIIVLLAISACVIAGLLGQRSADPSGRVEGAVQVASLAPCITGTLYAIGATKSIGLVSDYCPASEEMPRGGTALAPDLERILRSQSRVLLVRHAAGVPIEELKRVGEPIILPWSTVSQVASSIEKIGTITGHVSAAQNLSQHLKDTLTATANPDAPRVLLVIGSDFEEGSGPWVIKPNSMHGAVLTAAGYRNAIEKPMTGAPQISLEALLKIDPDYILHLLVGPERATDPSSTTDQSHELLSDYAGLPQLNAVRLQRIGQIQHPRILDEGPELIELVREMSQELKRLEEKSR
ncbi:MAG: ABC transporter substrate-binding protein [Planctomycetota bacterium]